MESFGAFWAILFTVQLPVLHGKKLVLLFFENLQRFTFAICNIEQLNF